MNLKPGNLALITSSSLKISTNKELAELTINVVDRAIKSLFDGSKMRSYLMNNYDDIESQESLPADLEDTEKYKIMMVCIFCKFLFN